MKNTLVAFIVLLNFLGNAQTSKEINIGKSYHIYSKILNEEREYYVYLPDDYQENEDKQYPVVYLLDANINFHSYTGLQQMLSRGRRGGFIPKMIVVGIVNTNRNRDLTPVKTKKLPEKFRKNKAMLEDGGGGENFLNFIINELRPELQQKYRTNSSATFVGHSFGGLTIMYTLLKHPEYFDNYLAIDPSIWWDDNYLFKLANSAKDFFQFNNKRLFFSSSKRKPNMMSRSPLENVFNKQSFKGLKWKFKNYPEENHGSVIIPSEYDGLKFLFKN
ncbi:alpha/beta hydrolase [Mesonia aestuariivivens]|uniref:Alpha/beta hydrolase n=1 Tax=Mesonia aestuariivivens TaxID=2796128 RepID=A0ABS6W4B0_9FLAO|nr:alpha/beta hydrolase-fold protein [Mesonia aestuariivivens]MBW2961963.1 hypothetical protein [Mesonia aestuariivivens]